ncbi:MAG TPA: alpha/beta fold hydrolase [Acidimicrobiia bacterium]
MSEVVVADGTTIHYDVFGRQGGSFVLMIQGLGADSRGWALQRLAFGRRYRCIVMDNRGVGRSDRAPGPYSLGQMAHDALSVLDNEGVERAHVMGASMGGVIAQIIGVMHPERTESLVLACTACRHHPWRRELLQQWADAVRRDGMPALGQEALQWLVGPRLRRRFGVWLNLLARITLQQPGEQFIAQVEAILDAPDELRIELATITCPTLVITGSQDSLTPVGDAEELAELIPGARLEVLSGAAHGLMVEAPNAFNDAVLRFLASVGTDETLPAGAHEVMSERPPTSRA